MRIGWRKLYSYLTRKPSDFYSVGLEYDANGFHLSVFQMQNDQLTWVKYTNIPLADWQSTLATYVKDNKLTDTPCVISFAANKYQILQVDRPAVQDEELAQALTWSIKELVMTQDELVVDYFDLPAQTTGGNKVNVVAVKQIELYEVCQGIIASGLDLQKVTVEELVTCDLLPPGNDAAITVIQEPGAEICLNIVKDQKLYFSRRIRGYEQLSTFTEMELQMGISETLSVELQRSMDFFESQLRQAAVKKIYCHLDTEHNDLIAELIQKAQLIDAEPLIPDIQKDEALDFGKASYGSLAAALAVDESALEAEESA